MKNKNIFTSKNFTTYKKIQKTHSSNLKTALLAASLINNTLLSMNPLTRSQTLIEALQNDEEDDDGQSI